MHALLQLQSTCCMGPNNFAMTPSDPKIPSADSADSRTTN